MIGNQLARAEPVLDLVEYRVSATKPDVRGRGRVYVYAGTELVQSGVRFHVMEGKARVDQNGAYQTKGKATIRAIFADQHRDVRI